MEYFGAILFLDPNDTAFSWPNNRFRMPLAHIMNITIGQPSEASWPDPRLILWNWWFHSNTNIVNSLIEGLVKGQKIILKMQYCIHLLPNIWTNLLSNILDDDEAAMNHWASVFWPRLNN